MLIWQSGVSLARPSNSICKSYIYPFKARREAEPDDCYLWNGTGAWGWNAAYVHVSQQLTKEVVKSDHMLPSSTGRYFKPHLCTRFCGIYAQGKLVQFPDCYRYLLSISYKGQKESRIPRKYQSISINNAGRFLWQTCSVFRRPLSPSYR